MSLAKWKKKFYPVSAKTPKTKKTAIYHSLRKWRGLFPSTLKKFGLKCFEGTIINKENLFFIDRDTCSLCQIYLNLTSTVCELCPLYISRGSVNCCSQRHNEDISPYHEFQYNDNPKPMIKWLKVTLNGKIIPNTKRN